MIPSVDKAFLVAIHRLLCLCEEGYMMGKPWKSWKLPVRFLFLLNLLFLLGGCSPKKAEETIENPGMKVTFFDVGKGDAILIETLKERMLIDTGYDDTAGVILDYLEKQEISYVDYLVLTHFDKDHVGGADWILRGVEVGEVLQPNYESDSTQFQEYETVMQEQNQTPVIVTDSMELSLGDENAACLIYPPQQEEYKEGDNDFSLVLSITYGSQRFLFAGDCEKARLEELLEQSEFELGHDLLKVPHHGREEKNSEEFFEAVAPFTAIITCSEEKPAEEEVLKILKDLGTEVYLTSDGTVTCTSDGNTLQVFQR